MTAWYPDFRTKNNIAVPCCDPSPAARTRELPVHPRRPRHADGLALLTITQVLEHRYSVDSPAAALDGECSGRTELVADGGENAPGSTEEPGATGDRGRHRNRLLDQAKAGRLPRLSGHPKAVVLSALRQISSDLFQIPEISGANA